MLYTFSFLVDILTVNQKSSFVFFKRQKQYNLSGSSYVMTIQTFYIKKNDASGKKSTMRKLD